MLASSRLRQWKRTTNRVLLTRVLFPSLRRCPPRVAYGALEILGDLRCRVSWRWRAALRRRVTEVLGSLPEATTAEVVRGLFVNRGAARMPELPLANCRDADLATLVTIEGREHVDRGLRQGKGVILLGAHVGLSRVISYVLRRLGYPLIRVGLNPGRSPLGRLDEGIYTRLARDTGLAFEDIFFQEPTDPRLLAADLKRMHSAVRANKVLFLTGDGGVGQRPVSVPFFGGLVALPRGWVSLVRLTGAPVMLALSARRCRSASFRIRFEAPLARELFERDDPVPAVAAYVRRLEEHIHRYPCQALPLFFGRPDGVPTATDTASAVRWLGRGE